jgi:hypothetical protein
MDDNFATIVERAFELARSGSVANMMELERALKSEGFAAPHVHFMGSSLRKQLRTLMKAALASSKGAAE